VLRVDAQIDGIAMRLASGKIVEVNLDQDERVRGGAGPVADSDLFAGDPGPTAVQGGKQTRSQRG